MALDMSIAAINGLSYIPDAPVKTVEPKTSSFESIFNTAMDLIEETNNYQLAANQIQVDFATGQTDDVLAVLLAQEKAFSSMNFTVQVTNKIIESYREIMRMQM